LIATRPAPSPIRQGTTMRIVPAPKPAGTIPIQDREAYLACPDGRIYSTITGGFLKPGPNKSSRLHVMLPRLNRKPGERRFISVDIAKLICTAFHGERPTGMTISHLNGNVQDNRAENLAWESWEDNHARKYEHDTMDNGFNNSRAVLSPDDITHIFAWRKEGKTHLEIAQTLGVSRTTISRVLHRKRYVGPL
jgi:Helix-turn-helix domain/HNH endonuclease